MFRSLRSALPLFFLLWLPACSAAPVDLDAWRAAEAQPRPLDQRRTLADDQARVEALRGARQLEEARALALALAAEHPEDGALAFTASRAESDGLVLYAARDKEVRDAAAASALDYAERADALGERSVASLAQRAWALGASTHLQPMGDRAGHARRTIEVAELALAADPEEPTAHATLAVVHLRLQTLPWIAKLMARDLPESSLEEALAHARRAVAARPSRENRLILARCQRAVGQDALADSVLDEALAAPPTWPRDLALEDTLRAERE